MDQKDGGPAFPVAEARAFDGTGLREGSHGMSLRDHFAGLAMQGEIAGMDQSESVSRMDHETWEQALARDMRRRAAWSYTQADLMLAERAKGQPVDPVAEALADLLAAAEAQDEADEALPSSMVGPEHAHWQALEEKAGKMRRAAIAKARGL